MTKNIHGNDVYTMLIGIIMSLTPRQADALYSELLPRYTKRAKTHLYNAQGEEDSQGLVRLLPSQYQSIRTKFGDTYVKKAFTELTSYIEFLKAHTDIPKYKSKLKQINSGTHNMLLAEGNGWVYNKCKAYIVKDRPKININPFLIDDLETARAYIESLPANLKDSMDVRSLLERFPQLVEEFNELR